MSDSRGFPSFPNKPVQLTKTEVPEPAKDSTMLLILVAVAALLVAAGGAWFFLLSGDGETAADAAEPTTGATAATPTPTAEPTPTASAKAKKAAATDDPRDPFKALVYDDTTEEEAVAALQGEATSGTVTTGGTGSTPGTETTELSDAPAAPESTGATVDGADAALDGVQLTLAAVSDDNASATVDVGAQRFVVTAGDDFAEVFAAEEFRTGTCATISYGERSLDLCEGESIRLS